MGVIRGSATDYGLLRQSDSLPTVGVSTNFRSETPPGIITLLGGLRYGSGPVLLVCSLYEPPP